MKKKTQYKINEGEGFSKSCMPKISLSSLKWGNAVIYKEDINSDIYACLVIPNCRISSVLIYFYSKGRRVF